MKWEEIQEQEQEITCPYCGEKMLKHIVKDGARCHVLHWDTNGMHCSEPKCEINHKCKVLKG